MEIQQYIDDEKDYEENLLKFIESGNTSDESYLFLLHFFDKIDIRNKKDELRLLLLILSKISKNHHRSSCFFDNIEHLFLLFETEIKRYFSNQQMFNFFKKNKRVILFLIKKEFTTADFILINYQKNYNLKYLLYFIPELQQKYSYQLEFPSFDQSILENYEEKRKSGENESYLCQVIREDLIDEFVTYATQVNLDLRRTIIQPSVFETNYFLIKMREVTLIQYAAFFGSIQIINFLRLNQVSLDSSLWPFAIHGNNAQLIHLLEENRIKPSDLYYRDCYQESVKCHHNEIALYIRDYFLKNKNSSERENFETDVLSYTFRYYNFALFPSELDDEYIFFYSCKYGYLELIKLFLNTKKMDKNSTIILMNSNFK